MSKYVLPTVRYPESLASCSKPMHAYYLLGVLTGCNLPHAVLLHMISDLPREHVVSYGGSTMILSTLPEPLRAYCGRQPITVSPQDLRNISRTTRCTVVVAYFRTVEPTKLKRTKSFVSCCLLPTSWSRPLRGKILTARPMSQRFMRYSFFIVAVMLKLVGCTRGMTLYLPVDVEIFRALLL